MINSKISCYLITYVFAGNILHLINHCYSYATDKHTDCYRKPWITTWPFRHYARMEEEKYSGSSNGIFPRHNPSSTASTATDAKEERKDSRWSKLLPPWRIR